MLRWSQFDLAIVVGLLLLGVVTGCGTVTAPSGATRQPVARDYHPAIITGVISNRFIREASGIATSQRRDDLLWLVNDGENPPAVFAMTTQGVVRAGYRIMDAVNRDWEDLSSFIWQGKPYLVIADVGDNFSRRSACQMYVVEEPEKLLLPQGNWPLLHPSWVIRFRYEDGPRDCEAVGLMNERAVGLWTARAVSTARAPSRRYEGYRSSNSALSSARRAFRCLRSRSQPAWRGHSAGARRPARLRGGSSRDPG